MPTTLFHPRVELRNYEKVYADYDRRTPSPSRTRMGQWIMGRIFKPRLTYLGFAREQIQTDLDNGKQTIMAANHSNGWDPIVIAAAMGRERPFKAIRTNTNGVVKPMDKLIYYLF